MVVAVPLGALLGTGLYRRFAIDLGVRDASTVPLGTLGLLLVAALAVANVLSSLVARRARRHAVAEQLSDAA
jgi:hypothetical protein